MQLFQSTNNVFCAVLIFSLYLHQFVDGEKYTIVNRILNLRLPGTVKPEKYELEIHTNLDGKAPKFYGNVRITVMIIVFHE